MERQSIRYPSPKPTTERGIRVGTLVRWDDPSNQCSEPLDIYSNEEILIGRSGKLCQYEISDPYVSNKHIRIYTILFDQDSSYDVAPLVYAEDLSRNGTSLNNHRMGLGNGGFLLSNGDLLWVTRDISIRFNSATYVSEGCFSDLQNKEIAQFRQQYLVTPRVLGFGAYGRVHMAIEESTGKQFACKMINLHAKIHNSDDEGEQSSKFFKVDAPQSTKLLELQKIELKRKKEKDRLERNQREAKILAKLSHPNIITLEKVFRSDSTIYIISELLTGGDLYSFIKYKGGRLEDLTAAAITQQVLFGVEYLHEQDILHRDIKPDNILLTSLRDGCRVILTDFGCAKEIDQKVKRTGTLVGTLEYCAPEICKSNNRGYTKAIDLWSLGCVTTVLVAGYSPFEEGRNFGQNELDMLEDELISMGASQAATSFIYRLLILDEVKRMDVKQALQHAWLTSPEYKSKLHKLYQHAIQDWMPHLKDSIIVDLGNPNDSAIAPSPAKEATCETTSCQIHRPSSVDHISESSYEIAPERIPPPVESPTMTAVFHFNPNSFTGKQFTDFRDRPLPQDPDDDQQELVGSPKKRFKNLINHGINYHSVEKDLEKEFLETSFKMAEFQVKEDIKFTSPERTFRKIQSSPTGQGLAPPAMSAEKKDEVYEEVSNPLSGKKRRYIYGRSVESIFEMT